MNTARSAGPALVPPEPVDQLRIGDDIEKAGSTGDLGHGELGHGDLGAGELGAGLTDLLTADAAGLHAYFLVLLAVALIAARTLMSFPHWRVGARGWPADGPRRGRSVPRSQWMIDPA